MQVGIFIESWHLGGVAVFCERLAAQLSAHGHSACLILGDPHHKRDLAAKAAYGQALERISCPLVCLNLKAFHERERTWRATDRLAALDCNAIILNLHHEIIPSLDYLSARTALIGVAHSDEDHYWREFIASSRFCDAYVGVSPVIIATLHALKNATPSLVLRTIPCGVPLPGRLECRPPQGPPRILVACRLEQGQKRVRDLPPIWTRYLSKGGEARLTICGAGNEESYLREAFAANIRAGDVAMPGAVPLDHMNRMYAEHDIFLNVSAYEGTPISVMEAAVHGLYPVLSRIRSGHPEIVEQIGAGHLCEVGDVAAFAEALLSQSRDIVRLRQKRADVQNRGRRRFGLERMASEYVQLLTETVRARDNKASRPQPDWESKPRRGVNPLLRWLLKWKYSRHYGWPR